MGYRTLRADCVVATIDKLERRIAARFPEAGLRRVAFELTETARRCADEAARLKRPASVLRACIISIWALGAGAIYWVSTGLHYEGLDWEAASLVQVLEPAMNIVVLAGVGVVTLGRLEDRLKRRRALDYLHELRSIAHVVDMHQLTKDPYRPRLNLPVRDARAEGETDTFLLERYLDYCSEMAALTGKLAALLAQSCRDGDVAAAASDIEQFATGLSRKIWQKIIVLDRLGGAPESASASAPGHDIRTPAAA